MASAQIINAFALLVLSAAIWFGLDRLAGAISSSQRFPSSTEMLQSGGVKEPLWQRQGNGVGQHDGGSSAKKTRPELPEMHFNPGPIQFLTTGSEDPGLPTMKQLDAAKQPSNPIRGKVLVAIVASIARRQDMMDTFRELCTKSWAQCVSYGDKPGFNQTWQQAPWSTVEIDVYMDKFPVKTVGDCCGQPTENNPTASKFFCDPHRSLTLQHQYRFLPAINHARRVFDAQWQSGALRWLVALDDDSVVRADRLEAILRRYKDSDPIYMGDFGPWTSAFQRVQEARRSLYSWHAPYACGGSGSVLSRAAVLRTDFGECERNFHRGCYQSDFMIGRCVSAAGVIPMVNHMSCGVCLPCNLKEAKLVKLSNALAELLKTGDQHCGFALFPGCPRPRGEPARISILKSKICAAVTKQAAITHGAHSACAPSNWSAATSKTVVATYNAATTRMGNALSNGAMAGVRSNAIDKTGANAIENSPADAPHRAPSVRGFLGKIGVKKFRKKLVLQAGITSVRDFAFLTAVDYKAIGMNAKQTEKLLAAASPLSKDPFEMHAIGKLTVTAVLKQLGLLKVKQRFTGDEEGQLKVHSLKELAEVTEQQLTSVNLKPVTRRRFLAAMVDVKKAMLAA